MSLKEKLENYILYLEERRKVLQEIADGYTSAKQLQLANEYLTVMNNVTSIQLDLTMLLNSQESTLNPVILNTLLEQIRKYPISVAMYKRTIGMNHLYRNWFMTELQKYADKIGNIRSGMMPDKYKAGAIGYLQEQINDMIHE